LGASKKTPQVGYPLLECFKFVFKNLYAFYHGGSLTSGPESGVRSPLFSDADLKPLAS